MCRNTTKEVEIKISLTAALLTAQLGVVAPVLQAAADPRVACKADFAANCPGVQPGGGRILACLKKNTDKLSPGCRAALAKGDKS